jgi:hypothetical protein
MLILGGSATVTDLTGMPTLAACFLVSRSTSELTTDPDLRRPLCRQRWYPGYTSGRLHPHCRPVRHHPHLCLLRLRYVGQDRLSPAHARAA